MGLTQAENSPGLSFEIDNPRHHYSPGDMIGGRVILNTAADSAIGKLTVFFWGRAKSRIIQQHGQTVTYHRGRTQFFNLEHVLYEGQYTHKPGSFSWPFEFIVPHQADPATILSGEKWKPKDHYHATTDENNLDLTLPASCYHTRLMFGRQAECFIEYVLSATLTEPEGLHHIRKPQTKTSTYPIIFHPLSTPEPIQNYNFTTDVRLITISTLKLLPQHAGTSLGFRDRARAIFQRDSIPKFSFSLTVQAPSIIQLFHPAPVPFLVTATPDLSPENTTIDTSAALPTVTLRSAKIELRTHVRCRASGTFADSKSYEIPILSYKILDHPLKLTSSTPLSFSNDPSSGEEEEALNLGPLCDLRLGNAKLGSRLETPLTPNFNTYNVARTYNLTWELELECAEKVEKFSSVKNGPECAVILPPATTVETESTPPEGNTLLGTDLAQAMSTASTGSGSGSGSGFWTRRSNEGRGGAGGEKEKATFGPSGVGIGVSARSVCDEKNKTKSTTTPKDQEAAEERAWARLQQSEMQYHSGYVDPFRPELDDDDDDDDDGDMPTLTATVTATTQPLPLTGTTAPITTATDADENQLPRYVP